MLETYQNIETLTKLNPWLCCTNSDILNDYYLCLHCSNHLMAKVITQHGDRIISPSAIEKDTLQNAILKLPAEQRYVIALKIIKGFSNQDTASILSKSIGAVKNIQNRALLTIIHLLLPEHDPHFL